MSEKTATVAPPKEDRTTMGYVIAGITIGAAIGNMFMAGKIRNVMKMQVPNPNAWRSETRYTYSKPNAAPREEFVKDSVRGFVYAIPPNVVADLHILQLPTKVVSESEIKEAYRKAVMKYHPDRIQTEDAKLKELYEAKFKQASTSYQSLIEHFVKKENEK